MSPFVIYFSLVFFFLLPLGWFRDWKRCYKGKRWVLKKNLCKKTVKWVSRKSCILFLGRFRASKCKRSRRWSRSRRTGSNCTTSAYGYVYESVRRYAASSQREHFIKSTRESFIHSRFVKLNFFWAGKAEEGERVVNLGVL